MHARRKRHLKVIAEANRIYSALDAGIEKAKDAEDIRDELTCKRGCNACCRMNVDIFAIEAMYIMERYTEFVRSRLSEIKRQADMIQKFCEKHGIRSLDMDPVKDTLLADWWWSLRTACPLMLENGECGVYEARPVPCRTHYVADDPAKCAIVPGVVIRHWLAIDARDDAYNALAQAWFRAIEGRTVQLQIGSLPAMMLGAYNTWRHIHE